MHPVTVSRVVVTALTEPVDRLRVLFELKARGLGPSKRAGKRSERLVALVRALVQNGAPPRILGNISVSISSGFRGICSTCQEGRYIVGQKGEDLLCRACWPADKRVQKPCIRCAKPDRLSRDRLCRKCVGQDKIRTLFTTTRVNDLPALQVARDRLLTADGPYLHNMTKDRTWKVLCQLVTQEQDITHEALDALLRPGPGMLRSFLVSAGVLPTRNERLHSFEQWIQGTSAEISHAADRRAFTGFARWRHLRRARMQELSEAQIAGQRRELAQTRKLLNTLPSKGLSLQELDQKALDIWQSEGPFERWRVKPFLQWCRRNGACGPLVLYTPPAGPLPSVFRVPEADRTATLKRILDPHQDIPPGLRLAAGLVIIYGFRSHAIVRLTVKDIVDEAGGVWIRLGPDPLCLPEELEEYAREAIQKRNVTRFGGKTEDDHWLFPGPLQDSPIGPHALRQRLGGLGVKPDDYRSTALGQIAQQLPSPLLARLTGLNPLTALRWNSAVSASYARNLPMLDASAPKGLASAYAHADSQSPHTRE
ncbi:hypothetical protein [Paenarthrobacter nicotinovorans]|uniref:hypothetical protein n=1 Tax=Paenarthrobacter nicotinovorans TaxID=29320 RepID=UPI0012E719B1|nr:hypothetical protein [Paenarthrobacter nicotinovorans]